MPTADDQHHDQEEHMTPQEYVDAVVAGLDRLGVPILDAWAQEDDDQWEGFIELTDDDTGALALAWHQEDGWQRLWRHGPKEPDAFSTYSNTEDAAPVDAPVAEVVRLIAKAAGADPNQHALF